MSKQDRTEPPERYGVGEPDEWPHAATGWLDCPTAFAKIPWRHKTRVQAVAACWAHRDSIIRGELERLRDAICPSCKAGDPLDHRDLHPPYEWCVATPIRRRLAELREP